MSEVDWLTGEDVARLPDTYQILVHDIGLKGAQTFIKRYQGTYLYLPKIDKLLAEIRNRRIRAEFTGSNHKALALKYGLTERWIYDIVNHIEEDADQVSFFENY